MEQKCKSTGHTERTGLYIIVILILLQTCGLKDRLSKIDTKIDSLGGVSDTISSSTK